MAGMKSVILALALLAGVDAKVSTVVHLHAPFAEPRRPRRSELVGRPPPGTDPVRTPLTTRGWPSRDDTVRG